MLVAAATVLLPAAAARYDCSPGRHHDLRFFLETDNGGQLVLSAKAPSAMNGTTWSVEVPMNGTDPLVVVRLPFPGPNHVLSERHGPAGAVRVGAEPLSPVASLPLEDASKVLGDAYVQVRLVEGERSVTLADREITSGRGQDVSLRADYPGHGKDAAPHTHGNGSDPHRALELKDLEVEFEFRVERVASSLASAGPALATYRFDVHIDGRTFLALASDAELAPDGSVEAMYYADGESRDSWAGHGYDGGYDPDASDGSGASSYSYQGYDHSLPTSGWATFVALAGAAVLVARRR